MRATFAAALALVASSSIVGASQVKVGVLASHDAGAWSKDAPDGCGGAKGEDLHRCNLKVYTSAVAIAGQEGVQLLVFPEGYALGNSALPGDYYEPLPDDVLGSTPCGSADASSHPAQEAMSCAARSNGVAVAFNVMSQLSDGGKRITEIVIDDKGVVISVYHKHSLFPNEYLGVSAGPFAPTTFDLLGQRWGVVICYEGIKPWALGPFGDFSQLDALAQQGATSFVWSVGGTVGLLSKYATDTAKKYGVNVVSTEGYSTSGEKYDYAAIKDRDGNTVSGHDAPITDLADIGYTQSAFVQVATLDFSSTNVV